MRNPFNLELESLAVDSFVPQPDPFRPETEPDAQPADRMETGCVSPCDPMNQIGF